MGFTYQSLMNFTSMVSSTTLAISATAAIYANPTVVKTFVSEIEIHNTNNSVVTVVLYLVPNSSLSLGTVALSSEMLRTNIAPLDTLYIEPLSPYILSLQNDAFFGVASLNGVNIQIRGSLYQ